MELEKIRQLVAEILNIDPAVVTEESSFIEDLGADSLDIFQVIMGVEEAFDIEVSPEEAERVVTVGDAASLVHSARKE
ncbi:MAG: acyl carrier protein [bacterium]|nr:acyl carrier protein [bacterium]MCM1376256.1 acyl carrier protein [Muribaculum sp.]